MSINLKMPDLTELKPRITVFGVGGAGGNAVNNMINAGLQGVEFVVANTDAQALASSRAERLVQMGVAVTEGLGAGSQPEVGRAAAEEVIDEINDHLAGSHMVFITAGMGGGTGTGAAPVIARAAREHGILTVGVVTKPFQFEGARRMRIADAGIQELQAAVDTLICIPNQNLFRIANERTTFADAFAMADQVLYSGVACITDLMVKEGLINLDFADVRSIMRGMGKAMMGTGEASGDRRALQAAEAAIANPLLDEVSMKGSRGLLISITGGKDLTLFEVDEAATRIREEVDSDANIILGATFDDSLEGVIRVSVVATGIDQEAIQAGNTQESRLADISSRAAAVRPTQAASPAAVAAQEMRSSFTQPAVRPAAVREPAPAPAPAPTYVPATPVSVATAAIEAALDLPKPEAEPMRPVQSAQDPRVTIEPYHPPMAAYEAPRAPEAVAQPMVPHDPEPAPAPYVPPVAERPAAAQRPRMPSIEDFPPVVQREARAQAAPEEHAEPNRPMSILRRLASVGLGRREDEPAPVARPAVPQAPAARPAVNEYAKRANPQPQGAAGRLDPQGRVAPQQARMSDDEQLEIPAFLRRQN
ncbi:cell division protein FtsZ [Oharaeibacter diazotrophicus]|uniref:Cell division protein FtsZ n=2 Tax=Oharaeibacter diazotrophicus TaxID=1920512 RepID=A0A4R6RGQ4_9HYPH|nr:cell division protein FtsZ [Oharaeibacter diazotrophicus]TDP85543.1 cell division protein FtsZ [Oharaeibacter diazotrophicus]BBE74514.1 cell division protein FtsZ [Pleomorphomonas sp. SM30]GLS75787.1 cell division protein FtsZ [Oharaeibacter diazotrophicus]